MLMRTVKVCTDEDIKMIISFEVAAEGKMKRTMAADD